MPASVFDFSSGIYYREFEKGRKTLTVNPQGPVTSDDPDVVMRRVGRRRNRNIPGYFLYDPVRRHQPAALPARIATLRS